MNILKKRSLINFMKYRSLIYLLVAKDLKVKYKRSVLGVLWSLLNPLLTMLIITIVFRELFRFNIDNFAAYVISGQVLFSFLSESTGLAMSSIYTSGQIIKKVYIPKYIFPITKTTYSLVNLLFSFLAVLLVCVVTNVSINYTIIFSFVAIIYLYVFCLGLGMLLSSLVIFFRDIEHFYGVFLTAWMYATPIIYPISIMPDRFMFLLYANPLYYYIEYFRLGLVNGQVPSWDLNLHCILYSIGTLALGVYIFNKKQDEFILHI